MHMPSWRVVVPSIVLVAAVAGLACRDGGQATGGPQQPVLLITVDGLVAGDLRAFGGGIDLPHLDRFLESGILRRDLLTAVPMTRPAVATYLTGLAPDRHGVRDDVFSALPEDVPTLATLLSARGYLTAAFPDSSFLGKDSGLWRGFDLVDDPPAPARDPSRWLPRLKEATTGGPSAAWIAGVDAGRPWFGWVHLSYPLLAQLRETFNRDETELTGMSPLAGQEPDTATIDPEQTYEGTLRTFDGQLGAILDAVEGRGDGALVVLAGTLGDVRGRREEPILPLGLGFSLHATRVEVPLAIRFPEGQVVTQTGGRTWAPDVAATIAAWAGIELDSRAEGRDLRQPGDLAERTVFSWSWAPLDQFGWHRLALAEDPGGRLVLDGDRAMETPPDEAGAGRLRAALATRLDPPQRRLPPELLASLLADFGIEPSSIPEDGRDFPDPEQRRIVAGRIWLARSYFLRGIPARGQQLAFSVGRRVDPENLAAFVDRGHAMAYWRDNRAEEVLKQAVERRPWDADIWHWYAHALLRESMDRAENVLEAVQPYLADQQDVLYDLACTRSLAGDTESSADYLARAWEAGFRDRAKIESDPDLRNLRESGGLSEVLRKVQ